jgi:hypothetical protein
MIDFLYDTHILQYTSLSFILNIIYNTWCREYVYAWLFLIVTITSSFIYSGIFLSSPDFQSQLIYTDKITILCIIIYGGYIFWKTQFLSNSQNIKSISTIPITSCFSVVYMYTVGYFQNKYSFDPNPEVANSSHGILHIIGCLGHLINMYNYNLVT